ncbi:MAG: right-handed parallel beta-helix repeat-containing protein [Planctomycetaceae bacterium]
MNPFFGILSLLIAILWATIPDSSILAADIWVSTTGNNSNSGASVDTALASAEVAAGKVRPGDRIVFADGTYGQLTFAELKGTEAQPIVIAAANPGQATVTVNRLDQGIGITLKKCEYVTLDGFHISKLMKGIDVVSSHHCKVLNNVIEQLGQEAIHVGRMHTYDGTHQFLGPASEHVDVIGNTITGTGKLNPQYGEGIYIGTGAFRGDDTHDILIENNTLTDISAEGVELKPGTSRVVVRGNRISNTHHEYNGAITVSVEGVEDIDGQFTIENNRIWNIKQVKHGVAGIAIGHGNTIIRNNLIWNIEGGIGIRVYQTFRNANALRVQIDHNTVIAGTPGASLLLHDGTAGGEASPLKAHVRTSNNLTDDGSAGSVRATPVQLKGPFTDDANAGQGPGSGFRPKRTIRDGVDWKKL